MKIDNFFSELKRRNVYKVAVAYAVVGWLLVQVATQVFPFFEIPNWVVRLVIVLVIAIGFPDRARHRMGLRTDPGRIEAHGRCRSCCGGATAASSRLDFSGHHRRRDVARFVFSRAHYGAEQTNAPDEAYSKSIAVLPFVNMSSTRNRTTSPMACPKNCNQLAQIPQLRVIARTSSFSFKGKEVDVATIAKALNVANVLEGSVRKSANTLRITAQLVLLPTVRISGRKPTTAR